MPKYYFRSYSATGQFEKVISADHPVMGLAKVFDKAMPQEFANLGVHIGWNETGFESPCHPDDYVSSMEALHELGYLDD